MKLNSFLAYSVDLLFGVLADKDYAEMLPPLVALDRALALGGEVLVACGSIYLVGEVRKALRSRSGVPEAIL